MINLQLIQAAQGLSEWQPLVNDITLSSAAVIIFL